MPGAVPQSRLCREGKNVSDGLRKYALQILSGPKQGSLIPLSEQAEFVIGRSADVELTLAEEMVSRRHARLVAAGGELMIADLGSTNGTFVNGEKVAEAPLHEGDRILIGTTVLVLIARGEPSLRSGGAMSGRIEEVSLPDLLQLFQQSQKTGTLTLRDGDALGKIHLRQGRIIHATCGEGGIPAEKAVYRLLSWTHGDFELRPREEEAFPEELKESTASFLMEGVRQIDEMRRLEPELPANGATITLAKPLPSLRDLAPEELDLLQLIHQAPTLSKILDQTRESDLETAERIVSLRERGYLLYEPAKG